MPQGGTMPFSLNVVIIIETIVLVVAGIFTWRALFKRDHALRYGDLS